MKTINFLKAVIYMLMIAAIFPQILSGQTLKENPALDEKVKKFLDDHRGQWYDLNITYQDGQLLHDIVLKGNYKNALEIGTSTGLSGIWIAWALSKTGGKLITIDIDEERHNQAKNNFKEAGLSEYIDARLSDAHTLVKELKGPFDFVFSDADKDWYINYFKDVDPKLKAGGCIATHNVRGGTTGSNYGGRSGRGDNDGGYYQYVMGLPNYESTLHSVGRDGLLVSYKRK
jgi:caffeoyl-CoA O-methyltransferase